MKKILPVFLTITFFAACGPSTKIVKSWHEPNASVNIKTIKKVLVIGLVKDASARRIVEDKLVSMMKVHGVKSYDYLTDELTGENNKLNEKLKSDSFDGVLIMRLVDVEKETTYVPGSTGYPGYYGSYYGYYRYAAPSYYNPGYYQTDKNYMVETAVYSVTPDKLIWSATTKTVNPENFDRAIEEIATAVVEKMRQDGFITDK